jgi:phosphomannomutase
VVLITGSVINPNIFRAYDIRGVYGKDLTEETMRKIGRAFADLFVSDVAVVGMDGRRSGPYLKDAFIEGILQAGKDVIDVGLVPRGACLFRAWKSKKPSAYVTASHLTKEWNGVKFSYEDAVEFFEEDNYRVRDYVMAGKFKTADKPGHRKGADATGEYKRFVLSRIPTSSKSMNVVIDCGNGTGGLAAPDMFKKLGFRVKTLFKEVDGDFPNRPSEITEDSLAVLKKNVVHYDFGVAYDGDSDRMTLLDEKGRLLGPELTSHIILLELAERERGPIVANVECLKIMDDIAKRLGRRIFRIRVGNSFMVREVEKRGACLGVERSGHFCIPSVIPMDDGIAASLYAASVLTRTGKKLSEIVDGMPLYPFRRFKVDCLDDVKFKVIESLKKRLSGEYEKVNTLDGVRVDFDYGWVLIRASNTGPIIRLSIEATDEPKLKELGKKFMAVLREEIGNVRSS